MPPARRYAARRQLEEFVNRRGGLRRRRRLVLGVALAVVLGSAAAGMTLLRSAPVTDKTTARCYTATVVGNGDIFTGTTIFAPGTPGSTAQVNSAITTCTDLWRQGFLLSGKSGMQRSTPNTANPVPALVACTLPNGIAGIFPGDQNTCASLGLPLAGK
jgi:hypothetical protein